jgi:hypothetical protein
MQTDESDDNIFPITDSLDNHSEVLTRYIDGFQLEEQLEPTDPPLTDQPPWRVSLEILQMNVSIIFDITNAIILGRNPKATDNSGILDLTPFGAHSSGVSRNHAILILERGNVLLRDVESTNGTGINGKKLTPLTNYVLHSGDIVQLGKLRMRVQFLYNTY